MELDDHALHRLDDDGGAQPDVLPLRIGIAPKATTKVEPSRLVFANGQPVNAEPSVTSELVGVNGEPINTLTWPEFIAWRKTKCRPFDRDTIAKNRDEAIGDWKRADANDRILDEIDQATHELIGEVAELGELFLEQGPTAFFTANRNKLIDEIGDIFFCANWALDAWGQNPLADAADDLELLRVTDENPLAQFAAVFASRGEEEIASNSRFMTIMGQMIFHLMLQAQTNAGLTSNSFKKLRFQRREQDVQIQVERIVGILMVANQILIIANSSVEEALKVNQKKLNARFPEGYRPGVGGGIRTGDGK